MFDFSIVTSWVHELLTSFMPLGLAIFIECVIVGLCILLMYVVVAILMIFMERKVCAAFQCRLGPMRVGPWGTLQVFADVFKMLTKEIITIRRSDKFLYNLAPYIVILASVLAFSCLPFNKGMEILDFNVGVFFMMAASSIGIVGILLAGWSSNNKYSVSSFTFWDGATEHKDIMTDEKVSLSKGDIFPALISAINGMQNCI